MIVQTNKNLSGRFQYQEEPNEECVSKRGWHEEVFTEGGAKRSKGWRCKRKVKRNGQ